jgi:Sec-independent protein translocase protein TatA
VVSAIIATLHLLFVIALIAVVVIGALRLSRGVRRRAHR